MTTEIDSKTLRILGKLAESRWANQDWADEWRGVWDGTSLERELDELFPVEVGLEALRDLKNGKVIVK